MERPQPEQPEQPEQPGSAPDALDIGVVDALLTTTRSVRRRLDLDRDVPVEVVLDCLRIATHAPTGSNRQALRWVVVTEPSVRREIGELYRRSQEQAAAGRPPNASDLDDRIAASVLHLRRNLARAPVLVIPCIDETAGGPAGWAPSVYPAVWSFQLALRSRGLGSCITTSHLRYRAEVAALLGIPPGIAQACLLPVAYYTGSSFQPARRRPVEEITFWQRWGDTAAPRDPAPAGRGDAPN